MQQMSICPSCGAPVAYGAKFCGSCGTTLMPPPPQQMRNPVYPQQTAYPQPPNYQPPPAGYMPPQQPGWNQQQAWGQPPPPPPGTQPGWGAYPQQPPQGMYGYRPASPPKKSIPQGLLLVLLAAILLILGGVAALLSSLPSKTPTNVTPTTPSSTPKPVETPTTPTIVPLKMTAKELIDAYQADGAAADAKYRSKTIQVTGTIASTNPEAPSLLLTPTGSPDDRGIRCVLTTASDALEVGKSITVEGFIGNYNIDILLMDSKIISK
jgi:hypothetical protein